MAPMTVYPMDLGTTVPSTEPWTDQSMVSTMAFLKALEKGPRTADRMEPGMMDHLREALMDS